MKSSTIRFFYALLVALFVATGAVGPAYAQATPSPNHEQLNVEQASYEKVKVLMESGWTAMGRHSAADDIVLVCPTQEVLDPSHPCSNASAPTSLRDLVLVCPITPVLDPSHPCADRSSQINNARPDRLVLVCPVEEVLDPNHPCAEKNTKIGKFKIPNKFVLTCPVKEVLEPRHPCAK